MFLLAAGVGAGLTGSTAGLASLISYPALLAIGLPPVRANVTNTVALVFNSVGSVSGSRPELAGQGPRLRRLAPVAAAGGIVGGILLLTTPSGTFEKLVPVLIGIGAVSILLRPRRERAAARVPRSGDSATVLVGMFLICIYGGYFGAAAGVLLLGLLLFAGSDTLADSNAIKNVVLGVANSIAALVFVVFGSVDWPAAVPLAVGLFVGGRIGPVIVRHSNPTVVRVLIAAAGVGLAVSLGIDAYS